MAGAGLEPRTATHYDSLFTALALDTLLPTKQESEAGIAQWLQRRTRDRKVPGSSPRRSGGRIFLLQGQLSVLTLISVSVPSPCYRSST